MKNFIPFLFIAFLFVACEDSAPNSIELSSFAEAKMDSYNTMNSKKMVSRSVNDQKNQVNENVERKLIKNGSVVFETNDLEKTKSQVSSLVDSYKGYISSDTKNEYDNKVNYYLNIRIPAQYFDAILSGISSQVSKFDTKEIRISDVTEEFLDVESRLKNKKELEKRYLAILQQAKTVKDILEVERELGTLREEIEATEGRLLYLTNQVSYATLSVSFYKKVSTESSFSNEIANSFKAGFKKLQSFFIFIISFWPFIILFSIVYLSIKMWRNSKKA